LCRLNPHSSHDPSNRHSPCHGEWIIQELTCALCQGCKLQAAANILVTAQKKACSERAGFSLSLMRVERWLTYFLSALANLAFSNAASPKSFSTLSSSLIFSALPLQLLQQKPILAPLNSMLASLLSSPPENGHPP